MIKADTIQHINVKIFAEGPVNFNDAVASFHQWIKDSVASEMLIDVAEYTHVPAGPGVLLIGLEANYSLDNREDKPGLLYNRKDTLEGTFQSRLEQAHKAALWACDKLGAKFNRKSLEVFINDRLLAPNTEETWETLKPELEKYFPGATLTRHGEPRDLFRVLVQAA